MFATSEKNEKKQTTLYRSGPDMSRSLKTQALRLKVYGVCFIYTYHNPKQ